MINAEFVVDGRTFVLRRATEPDVPALVALIADDAIAAGRGDDAGADLAPYRAAFAAIDADPAQTLVVLARDCAVLGTLQLTVIPGLARRGMSRGQIEAVRVGAAARGLGLGERMVRWAIDEAGRRGCGLVQLTTDERRGDAHRFYARLGFEHTHRGLKLDLSP